VHIIVVSSEVLVLDGMLVLVCIPEKNSSSCALVCRPVPEFRDITEQIRRLKLITELVQRTSPTPVLQMVE
jgi:hypothetical protein